MLPKYLFSFFLFIIALKINAQKISYQKLDSISTLISRVQKETESLSYKDEKGDTYQLSFPDDNFTIWANNRLASKAVYKKWGDREVLALTENIDLSKASGIEIGPWISKGVYVIKLSFPPGSLKTQLIENGKVTNTITEDYLEFFCKAERNINYDFLKKVAFSSLIIQQEKGLVKNIDEQNKDFDNWINAKNKRDNSVNEGFLNKYKDKNISFIFKNEIENTIKHYSKQKIIVDKVFDSLSAIYGFKRNLSKSDFIKFNPKASSLISFKDIQKGKTGIYYISTTKKGTVHWLAYCLKGGKWDDDYSNKRYFEEVQAYFSKIIPSSYYSSNSTGYNGNKYGFSGQRFEILSTVSPSYRIVFEFHPSGKYNFEKDSYVEISFIDSYTYNLEEGK